MGWDGPHNRSQHVAKLKKGWSNGDTKITIRKHHAHGAEDWYILDVARPDGTKESVITVVLWEGGYKKDMDEACGPYSYGCPLEWLDEVPEPEGAYNWRDRLKKFAPVAVALLVLAFASAGADTSRPPRSKIEFVYQSQANGDFRLFLFGSDRALVCEEKDIKIVQQGDAVNPVVLECKHQ